MQLIDKEKLLQTLNEKGGKTISELNTSSFAAGVEYGLFIAHKIITEVPIIEERKTGHLILSKDKLLTGGGTKDNGIN